MSTKDVYCFTQCVFKSLTNGRGSWVVGRESWVVGVGVGVGVSNITN